MGFPAEVRELEIARTCRGAHRRVVPLLEARRHQRLDVRGEKPRRGARGIDPELAHGRLEGFLGIGAVLGVLVVPAGDDAVDLAKRRALALDREKTGRDENRLAGFGESVESLVVLVEEEIGEDRHLGELLGKARCRRDPRERVIAMRAVGPVEGAEAEDFVAVQGPEPGGLLEVLALDVEDDDRTREGQEVRDDEADPLPRTRGCDHHHVRDVARRDIGRLRSGWPKLAADEAAARCCEHAVPLQFRLSSANGPRRSHRSGPARPRRRPRSQVRGRRSRLPRRPP